MRRFDFIYECPLLRDFPVNDFIRINFHSRIPPHIVIKVLRDGLLVEDPNNPKPDLCLYKETLLNLNVFLSTVPKKN